MFTNKVPFGHADWRSPLTFRTSDEILAQRILFNGYVEAVTKHMDAHWAQIESERLAALEEKAKDE